MKTLIGGAVAAVIGIIGLTIWFSEFCVILLVAIPIMLLLGGALAIYLGFDELKDNWKAKDSGDDSSFGSGTEDTEDIKKEMEDLKKTNEDLKKENEDLKTDEEEEG